MIFYANTPQELLSETINFAAEMAVQYSTQARLCKTATGKRLIQAKADAYANLQQQLQRCEIKPKDNCNEKG